MPFNVKLPPIYRGAAYKKAFRWFSQDDAGVKTPIDLAGKAGRIQLRSAAGDEPVYADWSTTNGKLIFDDTNRISIAVPRSETESYDFDFAQWDLLIWPVGTIEDAEVLMRGSIAGPRTITDLP